MYHRLNKRYKSNKYNKRRQLYFVDNVFKSVKTAVNVVKNDILKNSVILLTKNCGFSIIIT